ncbi:MAG TPA: sigma-70 family RNA polymerase sigma factor [Verrucomicrobiae bacterium]|jgi:RNA polymerase sigma factor (sigma-70 family)
MSTDRQLLTEFRREGSESAFEQLVERHLKLVYSTAMRVVNGDAHLAQDISQTVFANLARKAAKLPADVPLAGWLHSDARFTALEFLRKERRRITREQEASTMHEMQSSEEEVDWSRLRPILDETLSELEEEDRHALLLRFFEHRNLAEVGLTIGLSEDSARKRVSRALDKLRNLLSSRGVTTTTAALTSVLTSRGVESVPSGLGAQLTRSALAAAGTTAATSGVGIFSIFTSASTGTVIMASAALLFVGAAVVKFCSSVSDDGSQSPSVAATEPAPNPGASLANPVPPQRDVQAQSSGKTQNNPDFTVVLAKIQEVLHDPKPAPFENQAMREALAELGDHREAAIPILRTALMEANPQVSDRAADGLRQIGPTAHEAMPDILQKLRTLEPDDIAEQLISALESISPPTDPSPELAQIIKDYPQTLRPLANSLSSSPLGKSPLIAEAIRPALQDQDLKARVDAAYSQAILLRDKAGEDVLKVSIEGLKSTDEDVLSFALVALKSIGTDPKGGTNIEDFLKGVSLERFGSDTKEAVPSLINIANHSKRKDLRIMALELLDGIDPGVMSENPAAKSMLQTHQQDVAFGMKLFLLREVQHQPIPLSELLDGLAQHPGLLVGISSALAAFGPEARAALPTLKAAFPGLAAPEGASGADLFTASRARETVANAIQKIEPDQPKLLFTYSDIQSVMAPSNGPRRDWDRKQQKAFLLGLGAARMTQGRPLEMTPEQMHWMLDNLKTNDQSVYDNVASIVAKIDPHFFK